ncbi:MAG TPA: hypothetical protein VMF50_14445 [Candidatus Binataceae bacterium]|nr:hypothetical protein [Candidatus Binataceae bacterium]
MGTPFVVRFNGRKREAAGVGACFGALPVPDVSRILSNAAEASEEMIKDA